MNCLKIQILSHSLFYYQDTAGAITLAYGSRILSGCMVLAYKTQDNCSLPPRPFSPLAPLFFPSLLPSSRTSEAEGDLLIKVSDYPSQSSINTSIAYTLFLILQNNNHHHHHHNVHECFACMHYLCTVCMPGTHGD